MKNKRIFAATVALILTVPLFGACGDDEGDECKSDNDCSGNLICQPITGYGDRCCPTPPGSSYDGHCHATDDTSPQATSTVATAHDGG